MQKKCKKIKKSIDESKNICIYVNHRNGTEGPVGRMAHAEDCKSFYIGSIPVPASKSFRLSSAVEQSAVNRSVICSNQIVGAKINHPKGWFFYFLYLNTAGYFSVSWYG